MKILFTYLILMIPLGLAAQNGPTDSHAIRKKKHSISYIDFKFGGLASSFSHSDNLLLPSPGKKSLTSWHAGLSMDLFKKTNYNSRVELSYLSKGSRGTFQNDRISIRNTNRLHYLKLSALPLVIKTANKKINPYIALGGYYARRIGINSKSKTGQGSWENDPATAKNLNIKDDFGYSVSAGVYIWNRPFFELRYEAGLRSVSSASEVKNRSVILSFTI